MQMIWHDHLFIKFYVDKMVRYSQPSLVTYLPWLIEAHSITAHLAEETASVGTAYRDKICAGGSVVVILQPGRFSFWQVVHGISGEACLAPTSVRCWPANAGTYCRCIQIDGQPPNQKACRIRRFKNLATQLLRTRNPQRRFPCGNQGVHRRQPVQMGIR